MQVLFTGISLKAASPMPTEAAPEGYTWALDPTLDKWSLIKKTAEIDATLLSEFIEKIYPDRPADINVGSKVYVKATKSSGEVIRMKGTLYRVQHGDVVNSYFKQELLPLPENAV